MGVTLAMPDPSMYLQEYEVNYGASSSELIYRLHEEATLVHSRDLPDEGTDYFALRPVHSSLTAQ